jgi:hypothetical protein
MRFFVQLGWYVAITIVALAATMAITWVFMPKPIVMGQWGYVVGRFMAWLLLINIGVVALCSNYGWLPGLRRKLESGSGRA